MENPIRNMKYPKEHLENCNVRDLWVYARGIGIISPSLYKRSDLIEKILEVQEILDLYEVVKLERRPGRPPRISSISNNEFLEVQEPVSQENITRIEDGEGVVSLDEKGGAFLRGGEYSVRLSDPYAFSDIVRKAGGVCEGDYIKCKVVYARGKQVPYINEISEVNGEAVSNRTYKDFFAEDIALEPERLNLGDNNGALRMINLFAPLFVGARGVVAAPSLSGGTSLLRAIAQGVKANNPETEVIYLLSEAKPEEKAFVKEKLDCQVAVVPANAKSEIAGSVYSLVFNRAKVLAAENKDVVLLVDGLREYFKLSANASVTEQRTRAELIGRKKEFLSYARRSKNSGSITVIEMINTDDENISKSELNELISLANWKLTLSAEFARQRLYPAVDVIETFAKNDGELLPQKDYLLANKIRRRVISGNISQEDIIDLAVTSMNNLEFKDSLNKLL